MSWVWRLALGRVCRYARAVVVLAMAQRERTGAHEGATASRRAVGSSVMHLCSNELRPSLRPSELRHEAKREGGAQREDGEQVGARIPILYLGSGCARRDDAWSVLGCWD